MSKFKFRLQKLLDIRKDMEEQSKLQFKKAQQEKDKVVSKLNSLKENYSKYRYEDRVEEPDQAAQSALRKGVSGIWPAL